jgi:tRNA (guanine-N7-)-methyltransferase
MISNFKRIVSFARKRSSNPKKEAEVLQELLPKFTAIVPEENGNLGKIDDVFIRDNEAPYKYKSYTMEIGFGSGENIISSAKNHPDVGYIGCEVFTGGVVKLLKGITADNVENIRIWHADALELIERLPNNSLNFVYILHPDPWPKSKHNKRRLIKAEFLKLLASKMAPKAEILIVTDHEDYARWINNVMPEVEDIFERKFDDYPEIVRTKYRLKADAKGFVCEYFYLIKK